MIRGSDHTREFVRAKIEKFRNDNDIQHLEDFFLKLLIEKDKIIGQNFKSLRINLEDYNKHLHEKSLEILELKNRIEELQGIINEHLPGVDNKKLKP